MTTAKTAKNLLEGKSCDTCQKLNHCTLDGKEYCGTAPLKEDLRRSSTEECNHRPLPKYRTCKDWKESDPFEFAKVMFPVLRRVYPTMIAKEIVEVQPIKMDTEIFRIKYDDE